MCEKDKLLVSSNFSFSHNVFHSYRSSVHQNGVLCGNRLNREIQAIMALLFVIVGQCLACGNTWTFLKYQLLLKIVVSKSLTSLKMGHVKLKTRPPCQIFAKSWVWSRGHIFCPVLMKLGQNVCLNAFPNKPWFLRVCSTSLLNKTLWEKEKLLVTSNLSSSHSVFYHFGELSFIFIKFKIVVSNSFSLEVSKFCCFGKS